MTSQTGKQIIIIHILPGISRGEIKQTRKLGRLIEQYEKYIFFRKSCAKCGWEASSSPRLFHEKIQIEHTFKLTVSNVLQFTFIVYPSKSL